MNGEYIKGLMNFVEKRQSNELVVFGAGACGKNIIEKYFLYDGIKFICDNDTSKWGCKLFDIPILPPKELEDIATGNILEYEADIVVGNWKVNPERFVPVDEDNAV